MFKKEELIILSCFKIFFSVFPKPCLYGCTCYYSVPNQENIFDCRNKNLTSLPKTVLLHTNWILASGNNLGNIDRVEKYIENITHLDLRNSRVTGITDGVMRSMSMNVKKLNLSNNDLEILPLSIMEVNNDTKLWLSNDSYDCKCGMMWMRDWLVKATNFMDREQVACRKGKMIGKCTEFQLHHRWYRHRVTDYVFILSLFAYIEPTI